MAQISWIRKVWHKALVLFWLRKGESRVSFRGPYRGFSFYYVQQMQSHNMLAVYYDALEPDVTTWLTAHLKPGMSILTAGGFIGVHVLYMARLLQGTGRIDVFEGWSENFQVMTDHLKLNQSCFNLDVVHTHPLCLAERSGNVKMAQSARSATHHIARPDEVPAAVREVPATSVDDFWTTTRICPDVLMLDVEGWELPVLRGSAAMLTACNPKLLIEHHKVEATAIWLRDMDYKIQPLGERHFVGTR